MKNVDPAEVRRNRVFLRYLRQVLGKPPMHGDIHRDPDDSGAISTHTLSDGNYRRGARGKRPVGDP